MKGTFGEKLMYLLNEKGITKTKFTEELSLGINQIRRWETGEYAPTRRTVQTIADYFCVVPESLTDPERDIEYTYVARELDSDFAFLPLSAQERQVLSKMRELSETNQMRVVQTVFNLFDSEH